jgi:hypothetical protein
LLATVQHAKSPLAQLECRNCNNAADWSTVDALKTNGLNKERKKKQKNETENSRFFAKTGNKFIRN